MDAAMTTAAMTPAEAIGPIRRWVILGVLTSSVALYAMTVTIASVALPKMQGSLSATQDQIAWVITFNIVATAVATPLAGWLAGRFGRRNVMLVGVALFTVSSFLCGIATGLGELVVYRVLQGLAGAPLVPLSQAATLDTFPPRQHPVALSVFGMGVVIGPIIAPTLGGYLSEEYSWRWVFLMLVPCGVATFAGIFAFIDRTKLAVPQRLDWTGFIALALAIGCLQLMLDRGERNDWFDSAETIIELTVAIVAFYVFVTHTLTAEKPFLSPRIFLDRNFSLGILLVLMFGMLNFTPMVLFPPMLQQLRDFPDGLIGILLATRGGGTLVGFTIMLWAGRFDPRVILGIGVLMQAMSGWWLSTISIDVSVAEIAAASTLQGLGVGFCWVPLTMIAFATLNPGFRNEASAIFHLLRNMGSSIHISLSVAIVLHSSRVNYAQLTEQVTPYAKRLDFPEVMGGFGMSSALQLAGLGREIGRQALMIGYLNAFTFYTLTAFAVLPLLLFVRYKRQAAP
jgi:DHA2 family multidrug resistance protein